MAYIIPYSLQPMDYTGSPTAGTQVYQLFSESLFNSYPALLLGSGFDCAGAKDYMLSIIDMLIIGVVPDGFTMGAMGCGDYYNPYPTSVGWRIQADTANYGIDFKDSDECAINNTAPWPLVFGPGGNVDPVPLTFTQLVAGDAGDVGIIRQVTRINQALFNFDLWWCAHSGCCAPPAGNPGPHFLIPRPETPADGEDNVSTPPLRTPLNLSNHTFQFRHNFGRVK